MKKKIWLASLALGSLIFASSFDIHQVHPRHRQSSINDPVKKVVKPKPVVAEKKLAVIDIKNKRIDQEKARWARQKVVYLTFDDGPTKYTPEILDILKKHHIQATFFVVGNYIKGKEEIVDRIRDDGNAIGLHSMTHIDKTLFHSPKSYINEYKQEQKLLQSLGINTSISRTPYGSKPLLTKGYRDQIAAAHLKLWDWTIDSDDWRYKNHPKRIIHNVSTQIKRQHEVVLMHDHGDTVKALPGIIKLFKDKGYTFQAYNPDLNFMVNFWEDQRL